VLWNRGVSVRLNSRFVASFLLFAILLTFQRPFPVDAQPPETPLIAPVGSTGRIVLPGSAISLTARATTRAGAPLSNATVLFVAPAAGPSGVFPAATQEDKTYRAVETDGNGTATASFTAGPSPGVFLVEARVEGTDAAATFGITVSQALEPGMPADEVRTLVKRDILENAVEDESLRLHGPVLLPAGTQIFPIVPWESIDRTQPIVTEEANWFFWIDDEPLGRFAHGVRYVLVSASDDPAGSDSVVVTTHYWWPGLILPGSTDVISLSPPFSSHPTAAGSAFELGQTAGSAAGALGRNRSEASDKACAILARGPFTNDTGGPADVQRIKWTLAESQSPLPKDRILFNYEFFNEAPLEQPVSKSALQALIVEAGAANCAPVFFYLATHGAPDSQLGGGYVVLAGEGPNAGQPEAVDWDELLELFTPLDDVRGQFALDGSFLETGKDWFAGRGLEGTFVSTGGADPVKRAGVAGGDFVQALHDLEMLEPDSWGLTPGVCAPEIGETCASVARQKERKAISPFVYIRAPGASVPFEIYRPGTVSASARVEGTVKALEPSIAQFASGVVNMSPVGVAAHLAVHQDRVAGYRHGITPYDSALMDMSSGRRYNGRNRILVGTLRVDPGWITLNPGESRNVDLYRYGGEERHPDPNSVAPAEVIRLRSRDPGIANVDDATLEVPVFHRRSAHAQVKVTAGRPGTTFVDFSKGDATATLKVYVVAPPPQQEGCPDVARFKIASNITYNPGNHPFKAWRGRCVFTGIQNKFELDCDDSDFVKAKGDFNRNDCTFGGTFSGRVFGYSIKGRVANGRFTGGSSNPASAVGRTAGYEQIAFTYELGMNGGFPGGKPTRWEATGDLDSAGGCTYAVSPTNINLTRVGSTAWLTVSTAPGCTWTATANDAWLNVTSGASGAGAGAVSFQYLPNRDDETRSGSLTVAGQQISIRQVGVAAGIPVILNAVNGASFTGQMPQNGWVTITGADLSTTTRIWEGSDFNGNQLPTQLDGVSVSVNGKPAYPYYISPTQLNVLTEDDAAEGIVEVQVTNSAGASNVITAKTYTYEPALFMLDPEGRRYVAAVHADGTYAGKAGLFLGAITRPVKPGDHILLFGNGFGATDPPTPAGAMVGQPAVCVRPVVARIGGVNAPVVWAGKVSSGLFQFNLVVPDLPDGDHLVRLYVSGHPTQLYAYITIKG
jgi:uncharacterized protein (TIGR03437 family)